MSPPENRLGDLSRKLDSKQSKSDRVDDKETTKKSTKHSSPEAEERSPSDRKDDKHTDNKIIKYPPSEEERDDPGDMKSKDSSNSSIKSKIIMDINEENKSKEELILDKDDTRKDEDNKPRRTVLHTILWMKF
jgi:hypothetical protein